MGNEAQNNLLEIKCSDWNEHKMKELKLKKSPDLSVQIILNRWTANSASPGAQDKSKILCRNYKQGGECGLYSNNCCPYASLSLDSFPKD